MVNHEWWMVMLMNDGDGDERLMMDDEWMMNDGEMW